MIQKLLNIRWLLVGGLILAGGLSLAFPGKFVEYAYLLSEDPTANIYLIYAFGIALIGLGFAVSVEPQNEAASTPSLMLLLTSLTTILYFFMLTLVLRDWWIDDAGITFAYSRSLAEGHGLVAQPWLPAEEGYSSSIWMLLLSFMSRLGADIPLAAKYLGIGFSALSIALCSWILARETRSPLALVLCGIGIACTPTVVWAASGQEHALQGLLLLAVVLCVFVSKNWRWPVAVILSIFVLTRPEAPFIVIAVFCASVLLIRRARKPLVNAGDLAVALLPFLAFIGLMGFRMAYFGDIMPNPYYAKSSGTSLIGVFNPLGGGWAYLMSGLGDTALLFLLVLVMLIRAEQLKPWVIITIAIIIGHVTFVVWAKGDWMAQYRFLMPILPLALLVACLGLHRLPSFGVRMAFSVVSMLIVIHSATLQLAVYAAQPTTPMAAVTTVGTAFQKLAERLDIDDPVLAHHDAGGIAYHRMIRLLDLGGLVNRMIAQNMDDKAFLTTYLLEEVQPDFFFGANNFATASGFSDTEAFARDYVRLDFVNQPDLHSYLTHMRRSRLTEVSGVTPLYDDEGDLISVRVD